jgi:hypothetical protein
LSFFPALAGKQVRGTHRFISTKEVIKEQTLARFPETTGERLLKNTNAANRVPPLWSRT